MAMPELTAESPDKTSGNYGTLDQMFALKWIKRNIHAFGGSKKPRVTIFGQSAGAYNVGTLLASPLATDLFDAAIMQSTFIGLQYRRLALAEKAGTSCAAKHKCQKKDAKDTLACMRALSAEDVWACQSAKLQTATNILQAIEMPSVDGFVILALPVLSPEV